MMMMIVIIIIIIIIINYKSADTHPVAVVISHITYARTMKVDYSRYSLGGLHGKQVVATGKGKTGTIPAFAVGRATWETGSGNWERKKTGTIPAFALGPRKTKKNLCRDGRSLDLWQRDRFFSQ
jgi:hypothetical protein